MEEVFISEVKKLIGITRYIQMDTDGAWNSNMSAGNERWKGEGYIGR